LSSFIEQILREIVIGKVEGLPQLFGYLGKVDHEPEGDIFAQRRKFSVEFNREGVAMLDVRGVQPKSRPNWTWVSPVGAVAVRVVPGASSGGSWQ